MRVNILDLTEGKLEGSWILGEAAETLLTSEETEIDQASHCTIIPHSFKRHLKPLSIQTDYRFTDIMSDR
jgi:hypothetical protein